MPPLSLLPKDCFSFAIPQWAKNDDCCPALQTLKRTKVMTVSKKNFQFQNDLFANYTGPQKKMEWTLHVSILPLWILSRWIRIGLRISPGPPSFPLAKGKCVKSLKQNSETGFGFSSSKSKRIVYSHVKFIPLFFCTPVLSLIQPRVSMLRSFKGQSFFFKHNDLF